MCAVETQKFYGCSKPQTQAELVVAEIIQRHSWLGHTGPSTKVACRHFRAAVCESEDARIPKRLEYQGERQPKKYKSLLSSCELMELLIVHIFPRIDLF